MGIFDFNGEGEAVGGIVVMRYNENAAEVIQRVKAKMEEYDRNTVLIVLKSTLKVLYSESQAT